MRIRRSRGKPMHACLVAGFIVPISWNIFTRRHISLGNPGPAKVQPMHTHSLDPWTHDHVFLGRQHVRNERRTWFVVAITAVMMVGEIAAGSYFGSMALL